MLLFVGLGNPGTRHAGNRHNVGFMAVDAIARRHGLRPWRRRFHGAAADGPLGGERGVLLLPETYMNDSGLAVAAAAQFFKIVPSDIVVFHDEVDLLPGKLRVKTGGGNAGHNGLRSITALCGNDYMRVRLGVGHPGDKELVHAYVLSDFFKDEHGWVEAVCEAVADAAEFLVKGRPEEFQNRVHLSLQARGIPQSADNGPAA
jgi:PTH1 family peptidyl-tRNA hydrolase